MERAGQEEQLIMENDGGASARLGTKMVWSI